MKFTCTMLFKKYHQAIMDFGYQDFLDRLAYDFILQGELDMVKFLIHSGADVSAYKAHLSMKFILPEVRKFVYEEIAKLEGL